MREEYVKLQKRLAEVDKKYQVLLAASGSADEDNFVSRLLRTVSDLYEKERYRCVSLPLPKRAYAFFLVVAEMIASLHQWK